MKSYSLIDSGNFMKLEQVGPFRIARPSACAVWDPHLPKSEWQKVDAEFIRHADGNGEWKSKNKETHKPWQIEMHGITFNLKLTGFGHLGIFAEQEKSWLQIRKHIQSVKTGEPFHVLNLFAYTGGSTMFAAQAGAEVVHLDASKSSVNWARENAASSGLDKLPIRWIVDDVQEFVKKEIRRGRKYQGIILDPPSYGRGTKNQIWKIEEHLMPLMKDLSELMADNFSFMCLSAHSQGYTPISLENQLRQIIQSRKNLKNNSASLALRELYSAGEMLIVDKQDQALPSGAYCFYENFS